MAREREAPGFGESLVFQKSLIQIACVCFRIEYYMEYLEIAQRILTERTTNQEHTTLIGSSSTPFQNFAEHAD